MKYSIIIATYNRLDELQELFESFEKIDHPPSDYEVVIIDDGSSDGTEEFINSLHTPFGLQYHKQANQGPGAARNRGMNVAKGEYFIFIDSDVILPVNYLSAIDENLRENQWDAFGGPDDAHPSFPPLLRAINYSMTSFIGTGGTRGKKTSVTRFYPRSFNMGIHKKVHESIGGMSDLRHGQDMDYSARIYKAGFAVGLIADAVVFHKRRTSFWRFFKQIFNWGVTRINLAKKHEGMLKLVHLLPAIAVAGMVLTGILALFSSFFFFLMKCVFMLAGLIAIFTFFDSSRINRSVQVGALSVITLFIQVSAYGLGTWSGIIQILSGKTEAKGITRNYYK